MTSPSEPHATLGALAQEIAGGVIVHGDAATIVRDVRHDSRAIERGDVFVARRGQKTDGAKYVPQAIARGAAAVISDHAIDAAVPLLRVPDVELALAIAASTVWRHPSFALDVVGITGTNGKTTTAWLLEHALNALGTPTGLLGTIEHRFGALRWPATHTTPEADEIARVMASMRDAGATDVVMEVSSHALVLKRAAAVRFRVAALTNVTQDHLDFHQTFDRYAAAKRLLFETHGPASSVLNLDDAVGRAIAAGVRDPITYSAAGDTHASLRARECQLTPSGIVATIDTPSGPIEVRSPLVGRHNLENVLCALGVLVALEVPAQRAADALATARGAPGRLERVEVSRAGARGPAVFVDYAHTPDALTNVLRALRATQPKRLICVFGCGGDRDPSKRAPMGAAVAAGADIAMLTTDNPRGEDPARIAEQAAAGLVAARMPALTGDLGNAARGYVVDLDRRRAIQRAVCAAGEGDAVLIAGKGHEPYQEVNGVRTPFDDRDEARAALRLREVG